MNVRIGVVAFLCAVAWVPRARAQHAGHGGAPPENRTEKPREGFPPLPSSPGPHQVELKITGTGFSPAEIHAGAGDSVTLYVTRTADAPCKEINFFGRGLQVGLPLGETVKITIDVNDPGRVRIGCLSGGDGTVIKVSEASRR